MTDGLLLHYRVPIVIIVFIFLWGISLYILEKTRVDYAFVLSTRTGNPCNSDFPSVSCDIHFNFIIEFPRRPICLHLFDINIPLHAVCYAHDFVCDFPGTHDRNSDRFILSTRHMHSMYPTDTLRRVDEPYLALVETLFLSRNNDFLLRGSSG